MIPVLYNSTETEFKTNGIGKLSDSIDCTITEERNGIYELEMTYPVSGQHYEDLKAGNIILAKPSWAQNPQPFDIKTVTPSMDKMTAEVYAQHISYRLAGIPVKPFSASGIANALNGLVNNSMITNDFTVWTEIDNNTSTFTVAEPKSFRSCLGGSEGSILQTFSGSGSVEFLFDNKQVKVYRHRGSDNGVKILYGKNLTSLSQETSIENTYTGVLPYWSDSQTGDTVTGDIQYAENHTSYAHERIYILDCSSDYQEAPTVDTLNKAAQSYITGNDIGTPSVNLKVSFVDLSQTEEYKNIAPLERVNLCDTVTVQFSKLGVNAKSKVIKTVWNVLKDRYDSIELGDAKSSFASTIAQTAKDAVSPEIKETKTALQAAIDAAAELLKGGTSGHMVIGTNANGEANELYFMDTDDKATAKNVLRINMNGIAFSTTGINGTYTSAWTIDGSFVADFITAGTLNANLIKAGVIQDKTGKNYWNMETGEISINSYAKTDKTVSDVKVYRTQLAEGVTPTTDLEDTSNGWSTAEITWVDGMHIWEMVVTTMGDGTVNYGTPTDITGASGYGVTDTDITYGVSASETAEPSSWSASAPTSLTKGQWLWIKTVTTYTSGNQITTYQKSYIGKDGTDGKSVYVKSSMKSGDTTTVVLSNGTTDATLSIKDGADGQTGAKGDNGYVHVAWAMTADGSAGFSTTESTDKTYIGVYTDNLVDDSTDYTDYSWSKIKGENGKDGTSITVKSTQYQSGTSANTPPTGDWSDNVVSVSEGNYLWTKITFSDSSVAYSVSRQGKNGNNGSSITVKSSAVTYQLSTSGTTVPTGTWSEAALAPTTTQFLWTRTIVTFSDGTNTTSYSVGGKVGATGATGKGVSAIVTQYYLSSSNTSQTGGSWSTTVPSYKAGYYYWKREQITWINPSSTTYTTAVLDNGLNDANAQAGGRNLLENSSFSKNLNKWTQSPSGAFEIVTEDGYSCVHVTGALKTSKYLSQRICSVIGDSEKNKIKDGETYTLSGWYKATNIVRGTTNYSVTAFYTGYNYYPGGDTTQSVKWQGTFNAPYPNNGSIDWTYFSKTITFDNLDYRNSADLWAYIYTRDFTGDFYVRDLKLEKGNHATDWTPAPEDKSDIGDTVNSYEQEYYQSTSNTALSGGSWSTTLPSKVAGDYYWIRYKTTYVSGTVSYSPSANGKLLTDINELWGQVDENTTSIKSTNEAVTVNASQITSVQSSVSELSNTAATKTELANQVNATNNNLSEIRKQVAELQVKANSITASVTDNQQAINDIKQATAQLTTNGLSVSTSGATTKSNIDGSGLTVTDSSTSKVIAKFTSGQSEIQNVKITDKLQVGAHLVYGMSNTEYSGTTTYGTGFMWKGNG